MKSFPLVTSKFHREACPATLRLFVSLGNKLVLLNYGHFYILPLRYLLARDSLRL